jgi:hypothetical protein
MANKARGEVDLRLGDETIPIVLDLGTLAEMEDALKVESFEQLFQMPEKITAKYLLAFIGAVLKGNALDPARAAEVRFPEFRAFYADLIEASGLAERKESAPDAAPLPVEPAGESG